ncbi:MAG: acyltransferase family protein [Cyclobacteriaceae bacterium]
MGYNLQLSFNRGHLPALDGLRGLAITLVLLHHSFGFLGSPLGPFVHVGWIGVDLFFVLSGFLITGILVDSKEKPNYYRNFIGRRTLRIFPLYYLSLTLFFIFVPQENYGNYFVNNQIYFWTYTQNLLFAFTDWPSHKILNHFWSLAIEEQFYLFWPLIIWLFSTKNLVRTSIIGIVISLVIRNLWTEVPFGYTFTLARIDTLLIGALIAIMIRSNKQILERMAPLAGALALVTLISIIGISESTAMDKPLMIRFGYTAAAVMFGALLIFSFDTNRLGKFVKNCLDVQVLRFLGKYSYGIYVYHWILYNTIFRSLMDVFLNRWLATIVYLTITLILALLSYHLFESRFLKLKKYF